VARTRAITILFVDLVASTERRARLGDDRFDEFTVGLMRALRQTVAEHNGREVKSAGDGLMVVFPESVADAVACAAAMHTGVAFLDEEDPPQVRVGISTGEVAEDDGDYQGMPIVEAARLEAAAKPGQTLTTSVVRSLIGTRRNLRFRDVGALTLKGLPAPLPAVEVVNDAGVEAPVPRPRAARPKRKRRRVPALVVAAVACVIVAVVAFAVTRDSSEPSSSVAAGITPPTTYTPRFEPGPCPDSVPEEVAELAPETACGQLVVPQNRADPTGPQIRLLVERTPPRTGAPASAAPTIDVCNCDNAASSVARDHAELITMSTRGFFGTEPPTTCAEVTAARRDALTRPTGDPDANHEVVDEITACRARLVAQGFDPSQYNVEQASLDFIDLMVALRIDRADFFASTGSEVIVFGVLRRAPAAVRSITLDNPAVPSQTEFSTPITDLAAAFHRYDDLCQASDVCKASYPDLAARFRAASDADKASPTLLEASPPNPSVAPVQVLVDNARAADAIRFALGLPISYPVIPAAVYETTPDAVVASAVLENDRTLWDEFQPWGGLLSFECSYDVRTMFSNTALTARTYPEFVDERFVQWPSWCDAWDVPRVSNSVFDSVGSPVPVFMFRGDLTPVGTSDWIDQLLRTMPNGRTAIFPTLGKGLFDDGPPCLSDLRREFLTDPTGPLDSTACVESVPAIAFAAPG